MILVTGGAGQGKSRYAAELALQEKMELIDDMQERIACWIREGTDPLRQAQTLLQTHPSSVIVLAEVGCGIVPVRREDRFLRDVTGQIGQLLASRADRVILMQFGIPLTIKDKEAGEPKRRLSAGNL